MGKQSVEEVLRQQRRGFFAGSRPKDAGESVDSSSVSNAEPRENNPPVGRMTFSTGCKAEQARATRDWAGGIPITEFLEFEQSDNFQ